MEIIRTPKKQYRPMILAIEKALHISKGDNGQIRIFLTGVGGNFKYSFSFNLSASELQEINKSIREIIKK